MLDKIIKKHPFKLIAGIMLAGSLINPAQAANDYTDQEWHKGIVLAEGEHISNDNVIAAGVDVVGSKCDIFSFYFFGLKPMLGENKAKFIAVDGEPSTVLSKNVDGQIVSYVFGNYKFVARQFMNNDTVETVSYGAVHKFKTKGLIKQLTIKTQMCLSKNKAL